jgi:predicted dithiol-disulfide oxidoreductase (DUF899 family)
MDAVIETLISAEIMARDNPVRIRGESAEYRAARKTLLIEEIELRRQTERVAALRRALPPGGPVVGDYQFESEDGQPTDLPGLFAGKRTLIVYSFMFGPQRERPCPMCVNQLGPWDANAADLAQKLSLVVVARSPTERLVAWKRERGWRHLRLVRDLNDNYSHDYFGVLPTGDEVPALNVFTHEDGNIRHFWSGEFTDKTADPGEDPRGTTPAPLWQLLDCTPEGRDPHWYPKLDYGA